MNSNTHLKPYGWLLLILLAAVFLRFYNLAEIPPGLTHDEADHGITAWGITSAGVREIYFTIGYGREPLYDYATSAMMTFLGSTYLAGRITAAYFSLLLIAAMFAWVRRAFDEPTALLTAAGLAVGFWPVMTGRQALRSTLLPALLVLAILFFWRGLDGLKNRNPNLDSGNQRNILFFIIAGLFLGLTIYTYIPARALWIIFPALLIYLFLVWRSLFRRVLWPTGLMLLVMVVAATPLIYFLATNPASEVRIQQLAAPVLDAAAGDFYLLAGNFRESLRLYFVEGDATWRYNIAGKAWLGPLMGLLFFVGLIFSLWHILFHRAKGDPPWDRLCGPASFLALAWLGTGFLPVLVTGSNLSTTQAIGLQPVLYLFPALALVTVGQVKLGKKPLKQSRWAVAGVFLLFLGTAVLTYRDYFVIWANRPEVRVQYESTISTALDYLNQNGAGSAAISTTTPDRFHSPAVAQMRLRNDTLELHWFDARNSLLLTDMGESQILIPGFAPLSPALEDYFSTAVLEETLPLRESDLDRPLSIYTVDGEQMLSSWETQLFPENVQFGDIISLLGYDIQPSTASAGDTVRLVTLWQTYQPLESAALFAHVVEKDNSPIAQEDKLGVPGYSWQPGEYFLQLHEITLPAEAAPGEYPIAVGVYQQSDGRRLAISGADRTGDMFPLTTLDILP
ncbi:MAG: glycosyltransferase family 39 protein [Candidatus Promineifilaceae bacterium]|nr:glycosyltransferase family 39 protein [Candidatus Promineifilaceae bacterium]